MNEFLNNKNNVIASGVLMSMLILGVFSYIQKNRVSNIEEFNIDTMPKSSQHFTEKDIENTINKVFGKLSHQLTPNDIVPNITQGSSLFTSKEGNNNKDRIGVVQWFNISSKNRNLDKYPCASNFKHILDYKLWNVYSVELIRASLPRSQYIIDVHNNKMDVVVNGGSVTTITVVRGNYNIETYITALKNALTTAGISINITFSSLISRVQLSNTSGSDTYEILFQTGPNYEDSNFNELGFTPKNITLTPGGSIIGDRRVDLFGSVTVNIEINEINYNNGEHVMSTILLQECALTLYENPALFSKRHLKPLIDLNQMTFRVTFNQAFKKKREYNFNGIDYDLTVEIITVEYAPSWQPYLHSFSPFTKT